MQRWNPSKAIGFRGVLTFMKYILYLFSSLCYNANRQKVMKAQAHMAK